MTRRELFQAAGFALWGSGLPAARFNLWESGRPVAGSDYDWIRHIRTVIAEAYNPPFYPSLDYDPAKALRIARSVNADSLRYPAAAYCCYFPTKTKYPIHPELKGDPFRRTVNLFHEAGLKVIAYVPLNHPFMEVTSKNPNFENWVKRFHDGKPMTTEHYGFTKYFEGCLNSPLKDEIRELVRETLVDYAVDAMYFDGPYMGMQNARNFCHCRWCRQAYGKEIPRQDQSMAREDEITYTRWMRDEVVIAFLRDIRESIRKTRDVPVLFNDTSLLSKREWRSRAIPVVDGFMFEAAETPEEKLCNIQLGHSTGKVIWSYVGTHTQYNREHLRNERVRGWFSYPVESEELLLDGFTALAAGAGLKYWGLSRFFYEKEEPVAHASGRYVKRIFDFAAKHEALLSTLRPVPQAGILVGSQTIDWYEGKEFVAKAYENCYRGAWQVMKDNGYDAEPFLDYRVTQELLKNYRLVYVPNAACLSDPQCAALEAYVRGGGNLVATHMTSVADEYGRPRKDFALTKLFGASLKAPEPVEIPDLYWKYQGEIIPQDPQAVLFEAAPGARVLAETFDRGHRRTLGPAVVGNGRVLYIGSSPEAIYYETRMKVLRDWFSSMLKPLLGPSRPYAVEFRSGLLPHFMASQMDLVLHLLANTGNKGKKLRVREEYTPVENVKVRIRVPQGRRVQRVALLSGGRAEHAVRDGWVEATAARVEIYEGIHVKLA
jgi:hypothetical protein